jgi:hypothetical protein
MSLVFFFFDDVDSVYPVFLESKKVSGTTLRGGDAIS